jgi:hypothetical protein
LQIVRWLTVKTMSVDQAAINSGRELNNALIELSALGSSPLSVSPERQKSAQLRLDQIRSDIRNSAGVWQLSRLKDMLRGYRELAIAGS